MKRFIKPAVPGQRVRKENGDYLPDEGEAVEWSIYWERRINDGSVVEVIKTKKGE